MSKREFFQSWIAIFIREITSLEELEQIYDTVKNSWVREWM